VAEANLERSEFGLAPSDGWFVLNMRDAEWRHADGRGAVCVLVDDFEGERRNVQYGVNGFALAPGEPMALYHVEADEEHFLVVSGEAVLVVEGEERPLRTWDFFHCAPGTEHVIVGAGSGPCVVVAVGSRRHSEDPGSLAFPADAAAARHGASVEAATADPGEAYGPVPSRRPTAYRDGWLPD
jgi:mannose-6-phosphate isomerase-like protein (cupin superfamily)